MFDQLEIPHKFFQNWIVLRMLGIRDCVPLLRTSIKADYCDYCTVYKTDCDYCGLSRILGFIVLGAPSIYYTWSSIRTNTIILIL